jgi:receptor protein-tyrosine kinase
MSIFEKAFEKAGKNAGEDPADQLFDSADGLLNIPESLDEDGVGSSLAEGQDSEVWGEDRPQIVGPGKKVKLDLDRLKEAGLVDPKSNKTNRTTEEFRRIKRPLLMHARGEGATMVANANMIMVTSALPGEGKTFTAINLALSIAMEMDKTVLLIDADVAKPDVTARLGVEAEKGLIDILLDDGLTLPDVLLRTDIPKLTLLPSGGRHVHSTELLASERMRQLTLELSTRYSDRIVIFDSPPLLLTNEARVLAGLMGQIVLVAEESRTPQHAVKEAVDLLDANEIVGIVMNKGEKKTDGDGYGGYGYYSYGG